MAHYVEVYLQFWSCFKVWLKQNYSDIKDFNCKYYLIYPTFFGWFLQLFIVMFVSRPSSKFLAVTSSRCVPPSKQSRQFNFFVSNLSKNGFRFGISETNVGIKISIIEITVCAKLRTNLKFSTPNYPKIELGLEVQKTNVRIRISLLEIT